MNIENNNRTIKTIIIDGYNVDIKGYIKAGFELFKESFLSYIIFTLLIMVLNNQLLQIDKFGGLLFFLLSPLQFGYFIFAEKIFKNQTPNFKYFFDGYQKFLPIIQMYFINIFIFLSIFLLFFIPISNSPDVQEIKELLSNNTAAFRDGTLPQLPQLSLMTRALIFLMLAMFFYAGILMSFTSYLLWFQDVGVFKAIALSVQIIKKNFSKWIIFACLLILLNIVGILAFGIGILVTMPVSLLAFYIAYEHIVGSETELE